MAKQEIVDYLESELGDILKYEYKNDLTLVNIKKETGLPLFLLNDLKEYGYVDEKNIDKDALLIINTIRYCYNNHRFLRSAIGQLSRRDKNRLLRPAEDTRLKSWVYTRVFNKKNKDNPVSISNIYEEACKHFPSLEEQGHKGYRDIKRYVNNAKRAYLRNTTKVPKK